MLRGHGKQDPAYIKEKLVTVFVLLAVRMWPSSVWGDFNSQMMYLYRLSAKHQELALKIWQTLGEEVFEYESDLSVGVHKGDLLIGLAGSLLPKATSTELYPHGYRVAVDNGAPASFNKTKAGKKAREIPYEPGNEDGWLLRWAMYAGEIAQRMEHQGSGGNSQTDQDHGDLGELLGSVVDTIAVFMDWVPVRALVTTQMIPCIAGLLRVRSSDSVRQRAVKCLEKISRRNVPSGEYRDTILLEFASATSNTGGPVVATMAQAYLSTVKPQADSQWGDTAEALAAARTIAQTAMNLVSLHWARKKVDVNVLGDGQALIELLLLLCRDPRYTVSSLAMASWTAIIGHQALSKDGAVLAAFSSLAELTTTMLFNVCRASHLVGEQIHGGSANGEEAGLDEDEVDQFESLADLRSFLSSEVRSRLLGILRGTCKLEPTGFVRWIVPSLLPVLSKPITGAATADVGQVSVAEAAFVTVDTILSTLDEYEQRALADGDGDAAVHVQEVRPLCYEIGGMVVGFVTDHAGLVTRQLQTLPSFGFLLRQSAIEQAPEARQLLFDVLKKCTALLRTPPSDDNAHARELRTLSRRATGALVRIATAIPDSLMLIYGDLSQLVQSCLTDVHVSDSVKSYLAEFLLTLIAGASCSLPQRKELAGTVIHPLVESLKEFAPALESPQELISLLGLPALDALIAGGNGAECKQAMDLARRNRFRLMHVLATLQICLSRTLSGDAAVSLAAVWSDYVGEMAPVMLMLVRSVHALWNQTNWIQLPWQSTMARNRLFGLLDLSTSERASLAGNLVGTDPSAAAAATKESQHDSDLHSVEIRAVRHTLNALRESAYKSIGSLAQLPELFDPQTLPSIGENFAGCLFADASVIGARQWKMLLAEVVRPVCAAMGNWASRRDATVEQNVRVVAEFSKPWLVPLLAFCAERLTSEWADIMAGAGRQRAASGGDADESSGGLEEDIAAEKLLRDWTRAWSAVTADLLAAMSMWVPEASQIEDDLSSSARLTTTTTTTTTAATDGSATTNSALGAYILRTPEAFAAVLTAALHVMQHQDTHASLRTTAALARLAPGLSITGLLQHYAPPTPAHASSVNAYVSRVHASLVDTKSGGTIVSSWLCRDFVAACVKVLRDPCLLDVQDSVLGMVADVLHFSSFASHMPVHWRLLTTNAESKAPDVAFRATMVYSMLPAIQETGVVGDEIEQALEQIVVETEAKRRRALLRLAFQPMLAIEKSRLFSKDAAKKKKQQMEKKPAGVGCAVDAPDSWTSRSNGGESVIDSDSDFNLGSIMP
ncbi:karyopherin [Linderina macrospora]|uniref:Karyopherin n=1 Tax=Linderina macrospora TaxID=4868 RepID=A0ACC1JHH5_9FUNG|nr:karyopherin [Linderina macrospora]